jgi:hypothetical protein
MKTIIGLVAALIVLSIPAAAQNSCYRDALGNVKCLDGTSIYNQGNGLYGDRYGNRWQIYEPPPQPRLGPSNGLYDRLMDRRNPLLRNDDDD